MSNWVHWHHQNQQDHAAFEEQIVAENAAAGYNDSFYFGLLEREPPWQLLLMDQLIDFDDSFVID